MSATDDRDLPDWEDLPKPRNVHLRSDDVARPLAGPLPWEERLDWAEYHRPDGADTLEVQDGFAPDEWIESDNWVSLMAYV